MNFFKVEIMKNKELIITIKHSLSLGQLSHNTIYKIVMRTHLKPQFK